MTCREFVDFILDYLSGELAAEPRAEFEYHLRHCRDCQRYLASYEESVELGKRAFDHNDSLIPPAVPEDLVVAILAARSLT